MVKKPYPSEELERFIVRLPDGMRDDIAKMAKVNGRSMNSEIVARLAESFEPKMPIGDYDVKRIEYEHRLAALNTERELLIETGRHLYKIIDAQDVNIIMLQAYLLEMINAMPKAMRSDERVKIATRFALQLEDSGKPAPYQVPLQLNGTDPSKGPGWHRNHTSDLEVSVIGDQGRHVTHVEAKPLEGVSTQMSPPPKKRTAPVQKKH